MILERTIRYTMLRVLNNDSEYIAVDFKNRKYNKLYTKLRREGKLTGKIITQEHYDKVLEMWEEAKKYMTGLCDDFDEKKQKEYDDVYKKVKQVENTSEWALVKLYVENIRNAEKQEKIDISMHLPPELAYIVASTGMDENSLSDYYSSLDETTKSVSKQVNKEYCKLYIQFMGLKEDYEELKLRKNWLVKTEEKVKNFTSGKIVRTQEEFLEELNKLEAGQKQNNKRR